MTAMSDPDAPVRAPAWVMVAGAVLALAALGAGRLGILYGGFGPTQLLVLALAAGVLAGGVWSAAPIGLLTGASLGAVGGACIGITEAVHQLVRKVGFDVILKLPDGFVWMTPVANAVIGAGLGLGLGLVGSVIRGGANRASLAFALGMLLAAAHASIYTLDKIAGLVLCIGVGVQCARTAAARANPRGGRVRIAASAAAVVIGAGLLWSAVPRRTAVTAAPSGSPPNVLLVVLDTVRADALSVYGAARPTSPGLERLASRGVLFENAVSTSPWTLTAHATLFTGRYPHECSADWHAVLDDEHPTLAETFGAAGYATGGFVGNLRYCLAEFGIDRGFEVYEDFYLRPSTVFASASVGYAVLNQIVGQPFHTVLRNDATTMTDRLLAWQAQLGERPFFAFVNYYDAHAYCEPPPDLEGRFGPGGGDARDWNARDGAKQADAIAGFRNDYDACLVYVDREIERLLDGLAARGVLDNTLVVITADHGEQFGEHGLTGHGNSLYRPNLHVPLLVVLPGAVPAGRRVAETVSLRDVPRTILALTGIEDARFPGTPLGVLWGRERDSATPLSAVLAEVSAVPGSPPHIPVGRGDMLSLTEQGHHLIINGDGVLELFDWQADPQETRDLVETEAGSATAEALRDRLLRIVGR